jgi:hypothetical protein
MFIAWKMKPGTAADAACAAKAAAAKGAAAAPGSGPNGCGLKLDELMLEVGIGLVPLVDVKQGGQLLARVKSLRKKPGAATWIPGALHPHHRQSFAEGTGVCDLPARHGNCAMGDAPRRLLAVNSNPKPGDHSGTGNARAGLRLARQVDRAGTAGAGHRRWICGCGPHVGARRSSCRGDQAECA